MHVRAACAVRVRTHAERIRHNQSSFAAMVFAASRSCFALRHALRSVAGITPSSVLSQERLTHHLGDWNRFAIA
jgi:hypothetical protein